MGVLSAGTRRGVMRRRSTRWPRSKGMTTKRRTPAMTHFRLCGVRVGGRVEERWEKALKLWEKFMSTTKINRQPQQQQTDYNDKNNKQLTNKKPQQTDHKQQQQQTDHKQQQQQQQQPDHKQQQQQQTKTSIAAVCSPVWSRCGSGLWMSWFRGRCSGRQHTAGEWSATTRTDRWLQCRSLALVSCPIDSSQNGPLKLWRGGGRKGGREEGGRGRGEEQKGKWRKGGKGKEKRWRGGKRKREETRRGKGGGGRYVQLMMILLGQHYQQSFSPWPEPQAFTHLEQQGGWCWKSQLSHQCRSAGQKPTKYRRMSLKFL